MLETTWFVIWGLFWAVYFMLDGFDLGLGALMPFLAKDDSERDTIYNSVGPYWDGNEVWLIAAGGVTFAAFPAAYATMFSSLYSALMIILFALILRGAALGLRGESESRAGKKAWDRLFVIGSIIPGLLLGVAFANIFRGIPIDGQGVFQGNLLSLLNPYGLLGGALFLVFFLLHGSIWLAVKAQGELQERAQRLAKKLWLALLALFAAFLALSGLATGLWSNYIENPALMIIPAAAIVSLAAVFVFMKKGSWLKAWAASSAFVVTTVFFGLLGIYPSLLPSSLDPAYSVTVTDSASSELTLKIMLGVAVVFLPVIIAYQALVFRIFRGKAEKIY